MIDPQAEIDALLEKYPQILMYVDWVKYVPPGAVTPEGTTHTLTLANLSGEGIVVATHAKPLYAALADALLKLL